MSSPADSSDVPHTGSVEAATNGAPLLLENAAAPPPVNVPALRALHVRMPRAGDRIYLDGASVDLSTLQAPNAAAPGVAHANREVVPAVSSASGSSSAFSGPADSTAAATWWTPSSHTSALTSLETAIRTRSFGEPTPHVQPDASLHWLASPVLSLCLPLIGMRSLAALHATCRAARFLTERALSQHAPALSVDSRCALGDPVSLASSALWLHARSPQQLVAAWASPLGRAATHISLQLNGEQEATMLALVTARAAISAGWRLTTATSAAPANSDAESSLKTPWGTRVVPLLSGSSQSLPSLLFSPAFIVHACGDAFSSLAYLRVSQSSDTRVSIFSPAVDVLGGILTLLGALPALRVLHVDGVRGSPCAIIDAYARIREQPRGSVQRKPQEQQEDRRRSGEIPSGLHHLVLTTPALQTAISNVNTEHALQAWTMSDVASQWMTTCAMNEEEAAVSCHLPADCSIIWPGVVLTSSSLRRLAGTTSEVADAAEQPAAPHTLRHARHAHLAVCVHCDGPRSLPLLKHLPDLECLSLHQTNNGHVLFVPDSLWSAHTLATLLELRLCNFRVAFPGLFHGVRFTSLQTLTISLVSGLRVQDVSLVDLVAAAPALTDLSLAGVSIESLEPLVDLPHLRRLRGLQFPYADVHSDLSATLPALRFLQVCKQELEGEKLRLTTVNPPLADWAPAVMSISHLEHMSYGDEVMTLSEFRACVAASRGMPEYTTNAIAHQRKLLEASAAEVRIRNIVARKTKAMKREVDVLRAKAAADGLSAEGIEQMVKEFMSTAGGATKVQPARGDFVAHPTALSLAFSFLRLIELSVSVNRVSRAWHAAANHPLTFHTSAARTGLCASFSSMSQVLKAASAPAGFFRMLRAMDLSLDHSQLQGTCELLAQQSDVHLHLLRISVLDWPTPIKLASGADVSPAYQEDEPLSSDVECLGTMFRAPVCRSLKRLTLHVVLPVAWAALHHVHRLTALEEFRLQLLLRNATSNACPNNVSQLLRCPRLLKVSIVNDTHVMCAASRAHMPIHQDVDATHASDVGLAGLGALTSMSRLDSLEWKVPVMQEPLLALTAPIPVISTVMLDEVAALDAAPAVLNKLALFPALTSLTLCDVRVRGVPAGNFKPWPRSLNDTLRTLDLCVQSMGDVDSALAMLAAARLDQLTTLLFNNSFVTVSADVLHPLCQSLPALTDATLGGMVLEIDAMESFSCLPALKSVRRLHLDRGQLKQSLHSCFPHLTHVDIEFPCSHDMELQHILTSLPKLQTYSTQEGDVRTMADFRKLCAHVGHKASKGAEPQLLPQTEFKMDDAPTSSFAPAFPAASATSVHASGRHFATPHGKRAAKKGRGGDASLGGGGSAITSPLAQTATSPFANTSFASPAATGGLTTSTFASPASPASSVSPFAFSPSFGAAAAVPASSASPFGSTLVSPASSTSTTAFGGGGAAGAGGSTCSSPGFGSPVRQVDATTAPAPFGSSVFGTSSFGSASGAAGSNPFAGFGTAASPAFGAAPASTPFSNPFAATPASSAPAPTASFTNPFVSAPVFGAPPASTAANASLAAPTSSSPFSFGQVVSSLPK